MKSCPVCICDLAVTVRQGVEIDYCPRCRGVWLDRGELDKLIERSAQNGRHDEYDDDNGDGRRYSRHGYREADSGHYPAASSHAPAGQYPQKKKGFFGRMFDFD